jgi:hypothetical protein
MGYKATVDILILKELKLRAMEFAASYDPDLPTVMLVPGGMGSRLLKSMSPYVPGVPFPEQPRLQKIWLSFSAILHSDHLGLRMTRQEHDRGDRPVIPSGEVSSNLAKTYDNTQQYFAGNSPTFAANYVIFGYDWRKLPRIGATYLQQFLLFLRDENANLGHPDPRPSTTLLAHSQGGLVSKLFLNELADSGEDPDDWLARFISVGTPFYGTLNHQSRYYVGVKMLNYFTTGGRPVLTDLIGSLPGPFVLLPAPHSVLDPRLVQLGLNRYPLVDRDQQTQAVDPFAAAQHSRWPGFMTSPQSNLVFTVRRLRAAARDAAEIDRELPAFGDRIFHIGSTLRESQNPLSMRIRWKNVDGANYDIRNGDDPISTNGGDSDGTVPLWSSRLAWTAADQVFLARGLGHGGLAEHNDVLDAVAAIIQGHDVNLPLLSAEPEIATEADAITMLEQVSTGHVDLEELSLEPAPMRRRFEQMLGMS